MPRKPSRYLLERQLPSGAVKAWPEPLKLRAAGQAVAYCLVDNDAAGRKEATAVGMAVERAEPGTWVDGPGGYRFRLLDPWAGLPASAPIRGHAPAACTDPDCEVTPQS